MATISQINELNTKLIDNIGENFNNGINERYAEALNEAVENGDVVIETQDDGISPTADTIINHIDAVGEDVVEEVIRANIRMNVETPIDVVKEQFKLQEGYIEEAIALYKDDPEQLEAFETGMVNTLTSGAEAAFRLYEDKHDLMVKLLNELTDEEQVQLRKNAADAITYFNSDEIIPVLRSYAKSVLTKSWEIVLGMVDSIN